MNTKYPQTTITITSTFVADYLLTSLDFWIDKNQLPLSIELSDYGQVFQSLLDPTSLLQKNTTGINVLLVRIEDWLEIELSKLNKDFSLIENKLSKTINEFETILESTLNQNPALFYLILCPISSDLDQHAYSIIKRFELNLIRNLQKYKQLTMCTYQDINALYPVQEYSNPDTQKSAHIPYTEAFFTATGTYLMRLWSMRFHKPYKVIVVDCDNTLWKGVSAEQGVEGVEITDTNLALQKLLVEQQQSGKIICLCSKNEEGDVWKIFDNRAEMVLKKSHLVTWRINWQEKSQNLSEIAAELDLGLDSFIFIDDNPIECAEVKSTYPEILTLLFPKNAQAIEAFIKHTWAFDTIGTNAQGSASRTQLYQQNREREVFRKKQTSLIDFIKGLDLVVDLHSLQQKEIPRVSELTQRTNQFNSAGVIYREGELNQFIGSVVDYCHVVYVQDRFGDYGLVGAWIGQIEQEKFIIKGLWLSCRALGRGIEHLLLADIGKMAISLKLSEVYFDFQQTKRNQPVSDFLQRHANLKESRFFIHAKEAAECQFISNEVKEKSNNQIQSSAVAQSKKCDMDLQNLTVSLNSVTAIEHAIAESLMRVRDDNLEDAKPQNDTQSVLIKIWKSVLHIDRVTLNDNFFDIGGTSVLLTQVHSKILQQLSPSIQLMDLFRYTNIKALSDFLQGENSKNIPTTNNNSEEHDDIAIIGMAGRFPGAENIDEFWRNLCEGKESITFLSEEALLAEGVDKSALEKPNYIRAVSALENIDQFDANFFDISSTQALRLGPHQRILLECAWEALEHAGYAGLAHQDRTGIFAGMNPVHYGPVPYLISPDTDEGQVEDFQVLVSNARDYLATRVAYELNLKGPSLTVQTACSTSLVSVCLAAQALQSHQCDMALAGGVCLWLPHKHGYFYTEDLIFSPDGHCRAFDAKAQGTVFGEGVGLVVLKRLKQALNDGDRIYAVIKGFGINNDGSDKIGYTAPSIQGQSDAIQAALAMSQVNPETISYVEAHGTGTALGDPIEITALTEAYTRYTDKKQFCAIGSVKTNIGHLDAAAGIAGLIKAIQILDHKAIPASLHFEEPNPKINFEESPFFVNAKLTVLGKVDYPHHVAVSSFGVGGTNAHLILEEAPQSSGALISDLPQEHLLLISAKTKNSLAKLIEKYVVYLKSTKNNIADICYTTQKCRFEFDYKVAVMGGSLSELVAKLESAHYVEEDKIEQNKYSVANKFKKVALPSYFFERDAYWDDTSYSIRKMESIPSDDWFYNMTWQQMSLQKNSLLSSRVDCILVFDPENTDVEYNKLINGIHDSFGKSKIRCDLLVQEKLIDYLMNNSSPVYLIDAASFCFFDECTASALIKKTKTLLGYYQKIVANSQNIDRLVIVTNSNKKNSLNESVVRSLGKALNWECAFGVYTINMESLNDDNLGDIITKEIIFGNENEVNYEKGIRSVFRVEKLNISNLFKVSRSLEIDPKDYFLISGGLGGIGFALLPELLSWGAKNIILLSRGSPTALQHNEIINLEKKHSAKISHIVADVSDRDRLSPVILGIPKLAGIFHLAGNEIFEKIGLITPDEIENILAPKVLGVWNLHELTKDLKLKYFVLFSSIASLFGSNNQLAYVIANGYLDAFAEFRKVNSYPITHIQWGPWSEVGMAVQYYPELAHDKFIPVKKGFELLKRLLTQPQIINLAVVSPLFLDFRLSFNKNRPQWVDTLTAEPLSAKNESSHFLQEYYKIDISKRYQFIEHMIADKINGFLTADNRNELKNGIGFFDLGLDSLSAVELYNKIRTTLGKSIPIRAMLIFDYPTLESLTKYLYEKLEGLDSVLRIEKTHYEQEAIAVIGFEVRFPGGANNSTLFWENLLNEKDAIATAGENFNRWNGSNDSYKAGFIDDIDLFDAGFFNITPREAEQLDPQQRLVLETTWHALEHAAIDVFTLRGSDTGIFIGITQSDYGALLFSQDTPNFYQATGNYLNVAAGRLAYFLGTQGPAMAIDTACSSSLVSLHEACVSLQQHECHLAIAAGVNVLISPRVFEVLTLGNMLSKEGHCKTFDIEADGYVRGEGCGVIILKRLSDAQKNNDKIYALIKGSSVNQDGTTSGLTVPNGLSQEKVMARAIANANVDPNSIDYLEAHGTGTSLGDPIEIGAIKTIYGNHRHTPLIIGTVKTNIGHLESAAGIAGVIKVILSLENEIIPKHLHFKVLNPAINLEEIPAKIPLRSMVWKKQNGHLRRAGVSSFGFSGTNAHVILEEAPTVQKVIIPAEIIEALSMQEHLLIISAKTEAALAEQVAQYGTYLKTTSESIWDICYTSQTSRAHFGKTISVAAKSREALIKKLENKDYVAENKNGDYVYSNVHKSYLKKVALPPYPFQRQRYWAPALAHKTSGQITVEEVHPLLGARIPMLATSPCLVTFEQRVDLKREWLHFLEAHQVYQQIIFPGAGYVELLLGAWRYKQKGAQGFQPIEIKGMEIELPLKLEREAPTVLQVIINEESNSGIAVYSKKESEEGWCLHAQGQVDFIAQAAVEKKSLETLIAGCPSVVNIEAFYGRLAQAGLGYGAAFQCLTSLHYSESRQEVVAFIECDEPDNRYQFYPALLDAALQSIAVLFGEGIANLPVGFARISVYEAMRESCYVHARLDKQALTADFDFLDKTGRVLAQISRFRMRRASKAALLKLISGTDSVDSWCYGQRWQAHTLVASRADATREVIHYDARGPAGETISAQGIVRLLAFLQGVIHKNEFPTHLTIITENAVAVEEAESVSLHQAMLNGFIKTAILEHPELHIRQLDVAAGEESEALLVQLDADDSQESLFAYRDKQWYVARIEKQARINQSEQTLAIPAGDYQLIKSEAGILDELALIASTQEVAAAPEEVLVAPRAVGLNFRDVLNAMNLYPGDPGPLGGDFAGVITAVGREVNGYQVGDEVLGLASGSLASQALAHQALIVKKPATLSFAQAAAIPTIFLTVYYSLVSVAKLKKGETVLIHAGAGGVGLAAIQIAQSCHARIIATAGSEEKRAYLSSLGVDYVLDSRSLAYREAIAAITQDRGVDVVLNSLTGQGFVEASLASCAQGARFIEIGKRDIWTPEQVSAKRPDIGYFIVALDTMALQTPETVQHLFQEVMALFENKTLVPIHQRVYPLNEAIKAFTSLQQAKQIGKVVISLPPAEIHFNHRGSYLITGGLGGIGLEVARYLARQGAGRIILASRHAPNAAAQAVIDLLATQVDTMEVDISQPGAVAALIAFSHTAEFPLKGIFHAAGIIDDAPIDKQSRERVEKVFAPKAEGAWNLHEATQLIALDYFVLFSSIASLMGSAGQSNYAAANSFLDALAYCRHQKKLAALSINWGPWREVGMAKELVSLHSRGGLLAFTPSQGIEALDYALRQEKNELALMQIKWTRFAQQALQIPSWLEKLVGAKLKAVRQQQLQTSNPITGEELIKTAIAQAVKHVLGLPLGQELEETKSFFELGMDSLMALELKNRLQLSLSSEHVLSNTIILEHNTLASLFSYLRELIAKGYYINNKVAQVILPLENTASTNQDTESIYVSNNRRAYPLPFNKIVLWLLTNKVLHTPSACFLLEDVKDIEKFRQAVKQVVESHPGLWQTFSRYSLVAYSVEITSAWEAVTINISENTSEKKEKLLQRNYDKYALINQWAKYEPPLIRVFIFKLDESNYEIQFFLSHLVGDGISIDILNKEFFERYKILCNTPNVAANLTYQKNEYMDYELDFIKLKKVTQNYLQTIHSLGKMPLFQVKKKKGKFCRYNLICPGISNKVWQKLAHKMKISPHMLRLFMFSRAVIEAYNLSCFPINLHVNERTTEQSDLVGFLIGYLLLFFVKNELPLDIWINDNAKKYIESLDNRVKGCAVHPYALEWSAQPHSGIVKLLSFLLRRLVFKGVSQELYPKQLINDYSYNLLYFLIQGFLNKFSKNRKIAWIYDEIKLKGENQYIKRGHPYASFHANDHVIVFPFADESQTIYSLWMEDNLIGDELQQIPAIMEKNINLLKKLVQLDDPSTSFCYF